MTITTSPASKNTVNSALTPKRERPVVDEPR